MRYTTYQPVLRVHLQIADVMDFFVWHSLGTTLMMWIRFSIHQLGPVEVLGPLLKNLRLIEIFPENLPLLFWIEPILTWGSMHFLPCD